MPIYHFFAEDTMTMDPLPPCAFRRVQRGQTLCTRATDEFDQSVGSEICARCPVPGWLADGICKHLDIGTEVGKKLGAESPRVFTACRFFGVRLDGLQRCGSCPEFTAWEGAESPSAASDLAQSIPGEVLEEAMREALDRHVRQEKMRLMPQCFRAGATQCLRFPKIIPNGVVVLPPASLRTSEAYPALVAQVLQSGGVEPLIFTGPLQDVDSLCDLCLSIQRCPRVVIDLSEWDLGALFALGLAGALGRPMLLLRGRDTTPPFTPQGLPISSYMTGDELAMLLMEGLGLEMQEQVREEPAPEESSGQSEGEMPAQEKGPEQRGKEEKTPAQE
jgi:hypothetical protein